MKKRKRYLAVILSGVMVLTGMGVLGCSRKPALNRYDAQFLQLFDTVTSVVGYARDKEIFTSYVQKFYDELEEYHQLYDIYKDYVGINNMKTINDHAGIKPVVVDEKIIDLLEYSKEMYEKTGGYFNVAMGSVLSIWHEYRTEGIGNPEESELPPMEELEKAAKHMDFDDVIIDREASTVYLKDPVMSLDVGAVAKGYATEMVSRKLEEEGLNNALVSVGGNVRAIGTKDDGSKWKVGIQNPDLDSEAKFLRTVEIEDLSLVTSGSYQRYYTVDGVQYHHIVNPDTLMPWNEYASVSILCADSGMADALSTAVFNMKQQDGQELIESLSGVEAMWLYPDGTEVYSSGFNNFMDR